MLASGQLPFTFHRGAGLALRLACVSGGDCSGSVALPIMSERVWQALVLYLILRIFFRD